MTPFPDLAGLTKMADLKLIYAPTSPAVSTKVNSQNIKKTSVHTLHLTQYRKESLILMTYVPMWFKILCIRLQNIVY